MTSIGRISNSILSQSYKTDNSGTESKRQASDRQPQSLSYRSGGIINAVQKALNQMGLSMKASSPGSETDSSDSSSITADTSSIGQKALYKFLHSLFTVMQDQSNATSNLSAYSPPMTTSIQDIIQALQTSESPNQTDTSSNDDNPQQNLNLSNLQSDFKSLVIAIGGDATTGSSKESLRTFLQNLENNLNLQESSSLNVINTTA